jgi:hypothetical protein
MARARTPVTENIAGRVIDAPESTLLDVLDNLLNKGVMANGDVTIGVAGVDLIYLRLSVLLCAADRIFPPTARPLISSRRRRPRKPSPLKERR